MLFHGGLYTLYTVNFAPDFHNMAFLHTSWVSRVDVFYSCLLVVSNIGNGTSTVSAATWVGCVVCDVC